MHEEEHKLQFPNNKKVPAKQEVHVIRLAVEQDLHWPLHLKQVVESNTNPSEQESHWDADRQLEQPVGHK
jgi:hypothetical protein